MWQTWEIPEPLMSLFVCRPGKNSSVGMSGHDRPSNLFKKSSRLSGGTFNECRALPRLIVCSTRTNFGTRTIFLRAGSYLVSNGLSSFVAPVDLDALLPTVEPQCGQGNDFRIFPSFSAASQKTSSPLQFGQRKTSDHMALATTPSFSSYSHDNDRSACATSSSASCVKETRLEKFV